MTQIYHDSDADIGVLDGETVAILGYGNQGRSQALNLRDSGLDVIVGNIDDEYAEKALAENFEVVSIAAAAARGDTILVLLPDEIMPEIYKVDIGPQLREGALLDFASGYNIAFGHIHPAQNADVILVAPRMIGPGVRDTYVSGEGFPSFVGVHHDATGRAKARMLALAKAMGSTRAGCIEMSMHDEATLDLFTEQGFGPAFGNVLMAATDLLVRAGYPPEAVLLELLLSGELAYTFQKMRDVGVLKQMEFHSHTSQYGSLTRGARFASLTEPVQQRMQVILDEIRSGAFSKEWSTDHEDKMKVLDQFKEISGQIPFADWERRARAAFGIGDDK